MDLFTTKLIWAASFHCAVISSTDIPGKINWDSAKTVASLSWLLLPHPTLAVMKREFVVNRCWSKTKCHTDTDFCAPSGQEVLSQPGVAFIS